MAVIIIGAGVIGLSAAYHLARRQYGPIVLLDKGPVGDGSSSRAAGIITGLLWSDTGVRVRKRCLELFGELSRELDGYQFQQTGCLNLFSAEDWAERQRLLPLYDRLEAPYEILNGQRGCRAMACPAAAGGHDRTVSIRSAGTVRRPNTCPRWPPKPQRLALRSESFRRSPDSFAAGGGSAA